MKLSRLICNKLVLLLLVFIPLVSIAITPNTNENLKQTTFDRLEILLPDHCNTSNTKEIVNYGFQNKYLFCSQLLGQSRKDEYAVNITIVHSLNKNHDPNQVHAQLFKEFKKYPNHTRFSSKNPEDQSKIEYLNQTLAPGSLLLEELLNNYAHIIRMRFSYKTEYLFLDNAVYVIKLAYSNNEYITLGTAKIIPIDNSQYYFISAIASFATPESIKTLYAITKNAEVF